MLIKMSVKRLQSLSQKMLVWMFSGCSAVREKADTRWEERAFILFFFLIFNACFSFSDYENSGCSLKRKKHVKAEKVNEKNEQ